MNRERYTTEGFLAFADDKAGMEFRTLSYYPAEVATQIGMVAIFDNTTVTLEYPGYAFKDPDVKVCYHYLLGDSYVRPVRRGA